MPLFGRESPAHVQRIERVGAWARQRSGYALVGVMFGLLAVIESITMVIGIAAGIAAIALGGIAHRDLNANPNLRGRRLAHAAIILGLLGLCASLIVWSTLR